MENEYEATFTDIRIEDVRDRLKAAGAIREYSSFLQKRLTFNLPEGHGSSDEWIRVRDEADGVSMTYKSVKGGSIDNQHEVEFRVSSMRKAADFLCAIGAVRKAYQENRRELWVLDDVEVMIDRWPFLNPFVEIEGGSEEAVSDVADVLGFEWEDAEFCTVTELYAQEYGVANDYINNEISRITFDIENPFVNN